MGMYNAIIPDELLNPTGVFKERLSQSALYYETTQVADEEARAVRDWMEARGMKFQTGPDEETDLTDAQILAAVQDVRRRPAHRRRLRLPRDRHPVPAGAEGPAAGFGPGGGDAEQRRPPAGAVAGRAAGCLYDGEPLPHFNEVDECAGLDGLMTYRVHKAMGQPVENTLHDLRWGDIDRSGDGAGLRLGLR